MKVLAKVLNSKADSNVKVIMIEVNKELIYRVMQMLDKGGFQVDYRKVSY